MAFNTDYRLMQVKTKQRQNRKYLGLEGTVVLTKSDSDVIFYLQLLSKTLICTLLS